MRLLLLELKRVLKTKTTWIILLFCLVMSAVMAYLPITFRHYSIPQEEGQFVTRKGMDAILYQKEASAPYSGEVTPEKVRQALEEYQACLREYGVTEAYDLPDDVYMQRIFPLYGILHGLREVFADPETGYGTQLPDIAPEEVEGYYERLPVRLNSIMNLEQRNHPAAKEKANAIFSQVDTPYTYYPGYDSDPLDYQMLLSLLVMVGCAVICAPIFASDYQTGADDILRCTKHGRKALAFAKIASACIICTAAFLLCTFATLLISNSLYGWETVKTSIQMIHSITCMAPMSIWQFELMIPLLGTVSLLATLSLILLISARVRSNAISMAVSLFAALCPSFLGGIATSNLASWLLYAIPSAGFGIQTNYFYATIGYEFLHLGSLSFRPVEVMVLLCLVEIPLFLLLAVRGYERNPSSR